MTAYYVLQITDLSDPHNHRYSTVHPSNWDEGEGLVAAHAADNSYRMDIKHHDENKTTWWLVCPTMGFAGYATLERIFE
ncbi:Uncharacterised protein [Mycobacteroides abscessus subsp. abscessus]|nr:hypothetical protein L836_2311 [Mycobacteroides abscessus MAB_110811_2726]EUA84257.1 hypothetical protein I541_1047 [Mycobacteroides abscessus]SHX56743.1 Uncharacterised protein [Mycobacteroides abscessus subsp. abscessus]SHY08753.1 Uncharacterised protein [Mycobacteroides abscessus subsp. abscessus]SIC44547.1 Uncharacterised protein [Mycobacteroides abscessus subsp. abscessus]